MRATMSQGIPMEYSRIAHHPSNRGSPPPPLTFMGSGGSGSSTRDQPQEQLQAPKPSQAAIPAPPPLSYMGSGSSESTQRQYASGQANSWGHLSERELAARGFRIVTHHNRQGVSDAQPHHRSAHHALPSLQHTQYYPHPHSQPPSLSQPNGSQRYTVISQHGMTDPRLQQGRQANQENQRMRVVVSHPSSKASGQIQASSASQQLQVLAAQAAQDYQIYAKCIQGQVTNIQGPQSSLTTSNQRELLPTSQQPHTVPFTLHTAAIQAPHTASTQPVPPYTTTIQSYQHMRTTTNQAQSTSTTQSSSPAGQPPLPAHTTSVHPLKSSQTTTIQVHPSSANQPPPAHTPTIHSSHTTNHTQPPPPAHTTPDQNKHPLLHGSALTTLAIQPAQAHTSTIQHPPHTSAIQPALPEHHQGQQEFLRWSQSSASNPDGLQETPLRNISEETAGRTSFSPEGETVFPRYSHNILQF